MPEKKPLAPDVLICGTTIRLVALEATKSKWTAILVGGRPGRYIITEMPKAAGGPVKLDDGSRWAATFISKGHIYTFQTVVEGYTYRPTPLLFLEYPSEAEVTGLRAEKRYPVNIPMTMNISAFPNDTANLEQVMAQYPSGGALKALVVDLSEGGFMMASPVPLPLESIIEATFFMPQGDSLANIKSVVKTCRGKPGSYFVGLSYLPGAQAGALSLIRDLITNIENMPLRL